MTQLNPIKLMITLCIALLMMSGMASLSYAEEAKTYTIAEAYADKANLKGKVISIKGQVTKVSKAIMGKSWVHIEDGTGAGETKEIIFTSATESPAVGKTVTAKGTADTDRDFGAGYFYSVIVENSSFAE